MGRKTALIALSALALVVALPGTALAASGDLDTSFHGTGMYQFQFFGTGPGGFASPGALVVSNNKVIVAGDGTGANGEHDLLIGRLGSNGFLDGTCGNGQGFRRIDLGGGDTLDNGLAVLPNGKILIAGYSYNPTTTAYEMYLSRLKPNCQTDMAFAQGHGTFKSDFGYFDGVAVYDMAVLPDGKIILVGGVYPTADDGNVVVLRFNRNGTLDMTFGGGDGLVVADLAPGFDEAWRVKVLNDGKILVGGWVSVDPWSDYDVMIARFTRDGVLDESFGDKGSVSYNPTTESNEYVNDMTVVGDKILVCIPGMGSDGSGDVVLMRLNSNGKRDKTFGSFGEVALDYGSNEQCNEFAIQSDNKIVIAGTRQNKWFVARVLASGQKDLDFGEDGYTTFDEQVGSLATIGLDKAGRILVGGLDGDLRTSVARLQP